ncbi:MAG: glycosyltransferase family 4 protein [Candidatus Gastranaerophilaceae bacterium]|nr:hypothetical conserved protein [Clostridium sp. CAG:967]
MKILFITDLYPVKEDEKTTPRTLYDFVQGFKKAGHDVNVIKPNFILNSFLRGKPFYKTGQYGDVYNINYWLPFVNVKLPPVIEKPDIVIAHMPSGILFAEKLGLPFVAGIHNSDLEVLTNPVYSFYFKNRLKTALYKAKAVACRSYVIEQKLINLLPDLKNKTFAVPSGIDENLITELRSAPLRNPVKVLTCAQFKKRKNIDKVIEACKGLESFELTVIGDGKEFEKLKRIDKSVKFTGRLSHNKVLEKMRESDVFILPSVNETFGMVYLEAMSQGCITVCTKDDGISGIIKDGENGFLTLPISTEIRKILLNIKDMDDDRLKTLRYNSFHTIQRYTLNSCCNEYLQQLLKIL